MNPREFEGVQVVNNHSIKQISASTKYGAKRQGLQARTPSSDGESLPRGEGFGVGVTWAPVGAVQKKTPKSDRTQGSSKNRGYLLSHLVGQYHRRW